MAKDDKTYYTSVSIDKVILILKLDNTAIK